MKLRWSYSEPGVRGAVETWFAATDPSRSVVLADSARRQLVRVDSAIAGPLLIKHFKKPSRSRKRWEKQRAAWGLSPIDREWRALSRVQRGAIRAPAPVGRARLGRHQSILVCSYLEGVTLADALAHAAPAGERRRMLRAVGELVGRLHAAGRAHGDLHVGNILVGAQGPALLDLGRSRRRFTPIARLRDLGALDFSLARAGASRSDRMRVRRAALGLGASARSGGAATRRRLRRVGWFSRLHAQRYYRSRTRRSLRDGRAYARVQAGLRTGMRIASLPEAAVVEAVTLHHATLAGRGGPHDEVMKRDHRARITAVRVADRRVVVKEVVKRGIARRLADAFRGSPARRAWMGGHGLLARRIRAATPLAFVETKRLGVPTESIVVLEDLRPAQALSQDTDGALRGPALADCAVDLALRLHRRGVVHGDLQAIHVYVGTDSQQSPEPALIDLEGVRFPRRLGDADRIEALAQLNASLEDQRADALSRHAAFIRYARALPFRAGTRSALARIVRRSVERRHHWRGDGCRADA